MKKKFIAKIECNQALTQITADHIKSLSGIYSRIPHPRKTESGTQTYYTSEPADISWIAKHVIPALAENTSITELSLTHYTYTFFSHYLIQLLSVLECRNIPLDLLDLSHNHIYTHWSRTDLKTLKVLLSQIHVKEIRLSYCNLVDDAFLDALLAGLSKNVYLEKLDLEGNRLKNSGVQKAADKMLALKDSAHNLQNLTLSNNGHGNKALEHIASILEGPYLTTVFEMNLDCNVYNPMKKFFIQKRISKFMKNNKSAAEAIHKINFPTPSDRHLFIHITQALTVLSPILDNKPIKGFPAFALHIIFDYYLKIGESFSWRQWQLLKSYFLETSPQKQLTLAQIYTELSQRDFFQSTVNIAPILEKKKKKKKKNKKKIAAMLPVHYYSANNALSEEKDPVATSMPPPKSVNISNNHHTLFSTAPPVEEASFGNLFDQAVSFLKSGQYKETISLCKKKLIPWCQRKAMQERPPNISLRSTYLVLGEAYFKRGLFEKAIENFQTAQKYDDAVINRGGATDRRCREGIRKCKESIRAKSTSVTKSAWLTQP